MNTIKIKRGLKKTLPTLQDGELAFTTDTNELYIGTTTGNKLLNGGGGIPDAPSNNKLYGMKNNAWEDITNTFHTKSEINTMIGDIESALDAILGVWLDVNSRQIITS